MTVLPSLNSFTVVLIGGPASLHRGGQIDTRQDYESDPMCTVANAVAANSSLWWETATSLVGPMVETTDHLTQASVFGQRTVNYLLPNGEVGRKRLASLLEGGVSTVRKKTVTKRFDDDPWLLSDYDLHELRQLNADLHNDLFVSTDAALFTLERRSPSPFQRFETFVGPGAVLIAPHTRLAERFLDAYADWTLNGREPDVVEFVRHEEYPDLVSKDPPAVLDATFEVTGLYSANGWESPWALEAARKLKQTRYDLTLGLWDLVNDEVLRSSLLETEPLPPVEKGQIALPAEYVKRVTHEVRNPTSQGMVHKSASHILLDGGWEASTERNNHFIFRLSRRKFLMQPLIRFDLYLNKTSAAVYLSSDEPRVKERIISVVDAKAAALQQLYSGSEFDEKFSSPAIWRITDRDLESACDRAVELRPRWESVLGEAIEAAPAVRASKRELIREASLVVRDLRSSPAPQIEEADSRHKEASLSRQVPVTADPLQVIFDRVDQILVSSQRQVDELGELNTEEKLRSARKVLNQGVMALQQQAAEIDTLRSQVAANLGQEQVLELLDQLQVTVVDTIQHFKTNREQATQMQMALRNNAPPPPRQPPPPTAQASASRRKLRRRGFFKRGGG